MTVLGLRMNYRNHCICIFILSFLVILCNSDDYGICQKTGLCQCSFSNGVTINLSPLSRSRDSSLVSSLADVTIYFHPCSDAQLGNSLESACAEGASLCMYNKSSNTYSILGKSNEATFSSDELHTVFLKYSHLEKNAVIQLACESADGAGSTLVINAMNSSHASLVLKSPWACSRLVMVGDVAADADEGMSTGSLLVILFFVFTLIYVVGGALILKFLRGASGKEMIPNYDFWVDLPFLCRDGLLFLISGCKSLPAYDRI